MDNELVSIVIPTFKRPDNLVRAIDSVFKQTYDNLEVIVVDDNGAGTEAQKRTSIVLKAFSGYPIKYLVHEKNKGGSAARNTGLRNAGGDYITFLDDDDEISPDRIKKLICRIKTTDDSFGAVYSSYHILMGNGKIQRSKTSDEGNVYLQALARTFYLGSGSNLLFKKSFVEKIGGYDESFKRNQDVEFMARLFSICKVVFVNEDLLTIHNEVRDFKRDFCFFDGITSFYLTKMKTRIDDLPKKDKKRVLDIISLERSRVAFQYKENKIGRSYLKNVSRTRVLKYFFYLVKRVLTKTSYGFKG
jgi:glycosyltransferase involved in cell wall biosynthesis